MAVFFCCLFLRLYAAHTAAHWSPQDKQKAAGARDTATLYAKNCATCHGKDGRAKTFKAKFNKARNLTDEAWQREASDERLFNSIANGRGKMPAFGKKFSESEINGLVAFVRQFKK
jgi:mono/diheme cytochrome c family protein